MSTKRTKKQIKNQMAKNAGLQGEIRLKELAEMTPAKALDRLDSSKAGLSEFLIEASQNYYGANEITQGEKHSIFKEIWQAFVNPFTAILFALAMVSLFTDVILAHSGARNPMTVIIIVTMVLISGFLRFIQETRSGNAAAKLSELVKTTTAVERKGVGREEIPLDEVVVGDIVYLASGDMIPADVRILSAKDLFISQAALTGESEPIEKWPAAATGGYDAITEYPNLAFMGSTVISGSAVCLVGAVGDDTMLGAVAKDLSKEKKEETNFEKGVNAVSKVLIRYMLIMVPVVLFINGFTKGDWMEALLFAISVAVGLTPEMLPMIVTTCLSKGAVSMSKRKTIVKDLNSIQNLGSIDILCTDKTGTLTQDKVVLEYHLDVDGNENPRVLRHAFFNSYYQTGLKSLMDVSIIERTMEAGEEDESLRGLAQRYEKVDEIPFDFERRRLSVVVRDRNGKRQLVTKGAVEEMLTICSHTEYRGAVVPLTEEIKQQVLKDIDDLNDDGMRVVAVAQKTNPSPAGDFSVADESDMVLIGYLAFLDPPKETTAAAIKALKEYGVETKILTGDNDKVTRCICKQVGLRVDNLLLGVDVDGMDDETLKLAVEKTNVFAKLSPKQKARIVTALRENGHAVGYMGDGINDASAMKAADIGISVDNAVDIAKESANVILLEKDLMVLEQGIIEGRKVYANMIKYIKMTASSNFGNMFSVLIASAFLPFLPMSALHLILLNLIYDISCTAIPWDNVDREFLLLPRSWDAASVSKFMRWIGPVSSVFDITTYLLMYFIICPAMCGGLYFHQIHDPGTQAYFIALFQAGWFIESMWSQTLVIHMIRTPKLPFIKSRASFSVTFLGLLGCVILTLIPFTPIGAAIGLARLPAVFFAWMALTIALYMAMATVLKKLYVRRYGELL